MWLARGGLAFLALSGSNSDSCAIILLAPSGSSSGSCTVPTLQAFAPFLPPLLRRAACLSPARDGSQKQPARAFYLCGQTRGGCMLSVRAVGRAQSWCRACSAAAIRWGRAGRRTDRQAATRCAIGHPTLQPYAKHTRSPLRCAQRTRLVAPSSFRLVRGIKRAVHC